MDRKCAETLEALSKFIQSQRDLLQRTRSDIDRLKELRSRIIQSPNSLGEWLDNELSSSFQLTKQISYGATIPSSIDWSLYSTSDPQRLRTLALNSRNYHALLRQPDIYQRSELSQLQRLVKDAKKQIIDPILADEQFSCLLEPDDEDSIENNKSGTDNLDSDLTKFKKRKVRSCGGLTIPTRPRIVPSVFMCRDMVDESVDVDVTLDDQDAHPSQPTLPASTPYRSLSSTPCLPSPESASYLPLPIANQASHVQWSSNRVETRPGPLKHFSSEVTPTSQAGHAAPHGRDSSLGKRSRKPDKPKPETYKQPWSDSEQLVLEQLLEEIPDGEKNRWQKISRAMGGRRTPRQVASRVQKYFEKLKRFGVV